jgi:putative oxidoreductase
MMAHGITRLIINGPPGFGQFLSSKGFPAGEAIAWTLTFAEIICGLLLITGRLVRIACLFFICELLMGIILVHFKNGWFVVGLTEGGMEYSVLLIICFTLVFLSVPAAEKKE